LDGRSREEYFDHLKALVIEFESENLTTTPAYRNAKSRFKAIGGVIIGEDAAMKLRFIEAERRGLCVNFIVYLAWGGKWDVSNTQLVSKREVFARHMDYENCNDLKYDLAKCIEKHSLIKREDILKSWGKRTDRVEVFNTLEDEWGAF